MPKWSYRLYTLLLCLYPTKHRAEYGDQMLQTFCDLLTERVGAQHTLAIWWRVCRELPMDVITEHIKNNKENYMKNMATSKQTRIIGVIVVCAAIALVISLVIRSAGTFEPTTLSKVQKSSASQKCLQTTENPQAQPSQADTTFISNAVATSIIDVPAGTTVDVHFKTYSNTKATGSAIYSGGYGSYNFKAEKSDEPGSYTGGWRLTKLVICTVS